MQKFKKYAKVASKLLHTYFWYFKWCYLHYFVSRNKVILNNKKAIKINQDDL